MDIARPALIANIPGLQTPLIARSGGHTFSHADISGNARVHFGDVFNVSNDQPQPVREQPFTVPFCRDESFIPRDTVVEDLLKKGNGERHARAALYGLGGVGKTQIAVEFAYAYRDAYPNAAVFWLFAGTSERLLESFTRVAADLDLPGHNDQATDVVSLVLRYLEDFRNGAWLLVVDNLDDNIALNTTAKGSSFALIQNLPQTRGSCVLATSRDRRIAQTIADRWSTPIRIEPMSVDDAALLLEMRLPTPALRTPCQSELLQELECLPLAISQASAYMLHRHIDTTQYLQLWRHSHQSLISSTPGDSEHVDVSRDRSQTNAVFSTIQLTIARLAEECAAAQALLMIFATCNAQFIPRYFLDALVGTHDSAEAIAHFIGILCNLSLVHFNVEGTGLTMHKLVQGATQAWIVRNGQHNGQRKIIDFAVGMISSLWTECSDTGDLLRMCEISNHMHDIAFGFGRSLMDPDVRSRMLGIRGFHLLSSGRFVESCEVFREARDSLPKLSPESRQQIADRIDQGLALALIEIDRRNEDALALLRNSIKTDEKLGLPKVYKYLSSLDKLTRMIASNSWSDNRELETLLLRVEEWCQPTLAKDDIRRDALLSMDISLSNVYLARYKNWKCWREQAEAHLKGYSNKHWLSRATDTAREAYVELQALTTLDGDDCAQLVKAAIALGGAFREADRYREFGWCLRHALCITLNTPYLAERERVKADLLRGINAVQEGFGEPCVTLESFAAEHKDCRMGPHGCRFYAAELD